MGCDNDMCEDCILLWDRIYHKEGWMYGDHNECIECAKNVTSKYTIWKTENGKCFNCKMA